MGMMGRTHYEAYQEVAGARVVAVADADPKRAAGDLAGTGGNVLRGGVGQLPMDRITGTTDWRTLVDNPDVQIVDVCVPTTQHVELVTYALRAGKHVLCEKPLARTAADACTIADGLLARWRDEDLDPRAWNYARARAIDAVRDNEARLEAACTTNARS